jgi:plasmid stabilization system protein ParE
MTDLDLISTSLDAKLRLLAAQPMMSRAQDELSPDVRSMPFGRYVIFYLPLPDGIDACVSDDPRPGIGRRMSPRLDPSLLPW